MLIHHHTKFPFSYLKLPTKNRLLYCIKNHIPPYYMCTLNHKKWCAHNEALMPNFNTWIISGSVVQGCITGNTFYVRFSLSSQEGNGYPDPLKKFCPNHLVSWGDWWCLLLVCHMTIITCRHAISSKIPNQNSSGRTSLAWCILTMAKVGICIKGRNRQSWKRFFNVNHVFLPFVYLPLSLSLLARPSLTCLGLLCSYNDEDVYLFDTSNRLVFDALRADHLLIHTFLFLLSSESDYSKRYQGHRNSATGDTKCSFVFKCKT